MGWRDAAWAYTVDAKWQYKLPLPQKAVLAAVCMRTDDKTHQTFVGQQTIVDMTGASKATVSRALGVLSTQQFIVRDVRHGKSGYRTSDLITVCLDVREPSRQSAYKAESNDLGITEKPPTNHSDVAEEIIQIDHSDDHTVLALVGPEVTFDDFWTVWPRKDDRKAAVSAWDKAITRKPAAEIVAIATEYANHPHRKPKQFVPYGATWLNRDRWLDPMPEPDEMAQRRPTRNDNNLAYLQRLAAEQEAQKGISA
ncbi:MAG: hypothetical protein JWP85_980 [Rhodoglobus sp.]|nr:hypothetical protein [Rhodoglobus sp.]